MNRQCDLNEFEGLADYCIELWSKYKLSAEFTQYYGEQLQTVLAENAILKQQAKLRGMH